MRDEMAAILRGGGGTLAVGAVMGSLPVWLAPTVKALRESRPDTSIEVWKTTARGCSPCSTSGC